MLLIDGLLLAPLTGLQWVFEKIHEAALEELAGEADAITEQLRQLYLMVESGQITEAEFDVRERDLLDRFDRARQWQPEDEEGDEHPDEDQDEDQNEDPDQDQAQVDPAARERMEERRGQQPDEDDRADE